MPEMDVVYSIGSGLGDRHQQIVDGVATNYTLDLAAGLTQVLGDGTNTYLYGNGRISQSQITNPQSPEYFLGDALGSVRQLADTAGAVTLTQSYAPYGEVVSSVGTSQTSYAFTGENLDSYIKLIYLRSRYYAPETGRFLTKDSWQGDYNRPLSLNSWNYVEGNPANLTDPSGMCADPRAINYDGMPNMRECIYRGTYTGQVQTNYGYPILDTPDTYDGPYAESTGWALGDALLLLADACHFYTYQTNKPAKKANSYLVADINYEIHSSLFESYTLFTSFVITNNTSDVFSLSNIDIDATKTIITMASPLSFIPAHEAIIIKPDQIFRASGLKVPGEAGKISLSLKSPRSTVNLSATYP